MITTVDQSAKDLASSLLSAFASNDRQMAERLIAADFHFTSPLDNRIDRKTYFEICWPNSNNIDGFEIVRLMEHGDEVAVTYVGRSSDGRGFRNTEVMTCRNGQIAEVEVYFGWSIPHVTELGKHSEPS